MSTTADSLVDAASYHVGLAGDQSDPQTEFHLRHAEVNALVAVARYMRTMNSTLNDISATITAAANAIIEGTVITPRASADK